MNKIARLALISTAIFISSLSLAKAQEYNERPPADAPYRNSSLAIDTRVKDLVGRMSLREKFFQMFMIPGDLSHPDAKQMYKDGLFGFQTQAAGRSSDAATQLLTYEGAKTGSATETARKVNEIQRYFINETRLGIPIIAFDEALHGLVRSDATAFPQSIGFAATWNPELISRVGHAVAIETKSRGIRDILSPVVNIASDVRWGRTEETYGEDPYLSSRIGVSYVAPFEAEGVVTSPKHFIANVGDGGRDSYPIHANERLLREIYLPPFIACFKEAGSRSVMTSYNSLDGIACTSNEWLLRKILKEELGFRGFVISDAGATGGNNVLHFTAKDYAESTKQAVEGGLDVIFQTSYDHYPLFWEAYSKGMISPEAIDEAVSRILRVKFELGLFEEPYVDETWAARVNHSPEHQALAREIARESFVLLQNNNSVLPINSDKIRSVALIGYDVKAGRLGGYSGPGTNVISIFDGISQYLEPTKVKINYAQGVELHHTELVTIPASALSCVDADGKKTEGLIAQYWANSNFEGEPAYTEVNTSLNFQWTLFSPRTEVLPYDSYSVRWSGKISTPVSGTYRLGVEGNDGYTIYIDGKAILTQSEKVSYGTHTANFTFQKGRQYDIRIDYRETIGNAKFNVVWNVGVDSNKWKQQIIQAVSAARGSDVAIVTAGIHEGEFQDRGLLSLPGKQIELIQAVAATGKPVVVLLVGGSAITTDGWGSKVSAILHTWYSGDKGGLAVSDVVFGDFSPSGKLPITFAKHEGQLPLVYNHRPTGRGDDYYNLTGQPLYPFGYGLSYTTFDYSNLEFKADTIGVNGSTVVSCTVKNSGSRVGSEVVQLYVRDMLSSVSQPVMQLKGFEKISLAPNESRRVDFVLDGMALRMLDANMRWIVEPGDFRIMIGSSSKDIKLRGTLCVE